MKIIFLQGSLTWILLEMNVALFAIASRIFSVAAALLVALLVAPEIFGLYGRLQMLGLVFMVFAFLRLERAVVSAPSVEEACRASKMGLFLLPVAVSLTLVLSFFLVPEFSAMAPSEVAHRFSIHSWALLGIFCLSLAGKGMILLVHSWLSRWGMQADISRLILLQAVIQMLVQIGLLFSSMPPLQCLLIGEMAGSFSAVSLGLIQGRVVVKAILRSPSPLRVLASQKQLPLFNLPAAFMSQALVAMPILAFGRLADPATTGHLALAWRISEAPMQLVAATATSLAVTTGIWARKDFLKDDKRKAFGYVFIVLFLALGLVLAAQSIGFITSEHRLLQTAMFIPVAALLTSAIALGGPHADLVTFAGAERQALLIHSAAMVTALIVCFFAEDAFFMLILLAMIILLRSLALWVLLPHVLSLARAARQPKLDEPA